MIRKVIYLLLALGMIFFVSANSEVTYTFVVGQTIDESSISYNPPVFYQFYHFAWTLIAVVLVFVIFKSEPVSSYFKKRTKKRMKRKVVRRKK